MKRYAFRLSRVLRVRRLQEDLLRASWLEARARADAARASEDAQRHELELARVELERLQGKGTLAPRAVLAQQDLCVHAERELAHRAAHARTLEAEAARRADALSEARTAVRGLERLDERRRRAHDEESARREQAETDEVAARRFAAEADASAQRALDALERSSSPSGAQADSPDGVLPQPHPAS